MQIIDGFSNWKNATSLFAQHEKSSCHRQAVDVVITIPATNRDVAEMLSSQLVKEKENNRCMLIMIITCLQFLVRQGLPLRGDGDEQYSNFYQLLKLKGMDNPLLSDWLQRKSSKYTSHDIQNEIVKVMSMQVLRRIVLNLQLSPFLALMMDESADNSNVEQVVYVMRWIDERLEVHEEFLGLYSVPAINSDTLMSVTQDVFLRMNIPFAKIQGQCYDGASVMKGSKSGISTRILQKEPRAIYTHCYGHSINLAASDAIKSVKLLKDALDITHEITKLIKYSPRREAVFREIKECHEAAVGNHSVGIRVLCPTRWTVRAKVLKSIINNYSILQSTWDEALEIAKDSETKARLIGVSTQMQQFNYLFGVFLAEMLLQHTDNLNQSLQKETLSAAEAQHLG